MIYYIYTVTVFKKEDIENTNERTASIVLIIIHPSSTSTSS